MPTFLFLIFILCNQTIIYAQQKIDAAVQLDSFSCYLLVGDQVINYNLESNKIQKQSRIAEMFPGVYFDKIDALSRLNQDTLMFINDGKALFFSKKNNWILNDKALNLDHTFLKFYSSRPLDAMVIWSNNKYFTFSGDLYNRYTGPSLQLNDHYPKKISKENWPGLTFKTIDAAFREHNGHLYLFSDDQCIQFSQEKDSVCLGFPKKIHSIFNLNSYDPIADVIDFKAFLNIDKQDKGWQVNIAHQGLQTFVARNKRLNQKWRKSNQNRWFGEHVVFECSKKLDDRSLFLMCAWADLCWKWMKNSTEFHPPIDKASYLDGRTVISLKVNSQKDNESKKISLALNESPYDCIFNSLQKGTLIAIKANLFNEILLHFSKNNFFCLSGKDSALNKRSVELYNHVLVDLVSLYFCNENFPIDTTGYNNPELRAKLDLQDFILDASVDTLDVYNMQSSKNLIKQLKAVLFYVFVNYGAQKCLNRMYGAQKYMTKPESQQALLDNYYILCAYAAQQNFYPLFHKVFKYPISDSAKQIVDDLNLHSN